MTGREEQTLGLLAMSLAALAIVLCWAIWTSDSGSTPPREPRIEIGTQP